MPRRHALELVTDAAGDAVVRRDWQALRDAGLASQLDHTGGTNTPHLTVLSAPAVGAELEAAAVDLLGPLLPIEVRTSGVAVLGGDRVTIARLVDVTGEVTRSVLGLMGRAEDQLRPGWLPHVTLARRVPRTEIQRALDVLGHDDVVLTFDTLRRWDPESGTVRTLVAPH